MKEIMELLEKEGFESYIAGGYVRDYLLGRETHDVDICTNASIDDLMSVLYRHEDVSPLVRRRNGLHMPPQ